MVETHREENFWRSGMAVVLALAAVKLVLHLVFNRGYGYFRDELYYLACAEHLDWGYVDHPPLVAVYAWVGRALGGSLSAIRLLPAVAGAATVALAGLLARELGGGRWAQGLAALAALVAPVYFVLHNFLSMNAVEPVLWMGCAWVLIRIIKTGDGRLWLVFGALAGLGVLNKHSALFFGAAVVAGLVLTRERRWLRSGWLWAGGAVALLVMLPNLLWQVQHDFATYELLRNVKESTKNIVLAPHEYFLQQILLFSPATALVWLAGLGFFFFHREGRRYRLLGWTWLVLLGIFIVLEGKHYYLAPAYPMLLAGGAVLWQQWSEPRRWLRPALVVLLVAFGLLSAPMVLPVLPPDELVEYQDFLSTLGLAPARTEASHTAALPQHFADQFGWEEMVAATARVYHALPPEERARTVIFADNYGQAGAVDFFGPRHGLPRAFSGHQNYWFWGPPPESAEVVIILGSRGEDLHEFFGACQRPVELHHPWAIPHENRPIFVCREPKFRFSEVWPALKKWL